MNVMFAVINCNQDHDVFENAYHIILVCNRLKHAIATSVSPVLKRRRKKRSRGSAAFSRVEKIPKATLTISTDPLHKEIWAK